MNTSASLSSLSLTMVFQQLKLNPSLFSKFYEKIEKVLNAKNCSYRELYIAAVSIREALNIVSNYAELVKSALKLYSKSLSPEMGPIASLGWGFHKDCYFSLILFLERVLQRKVINAK